MFVSQFQAKRRCTSASENKTHQLVKENSSYFFFAPYLQICGSKSTSVSSVDGSKGDVEVKVFANWKRRRRRERRRRISPCGIQYSPDAFIFLLF